MARPLWDKRTPLWLAASIIVVGVSGLVLWRGESNPPRNLGVGFRRDF